MLEKRRDLVISSQALKYQGRFRDYNEGFPTGTWDSPFLLETIGVKEPPDAGSIPAPATRIENKKKRLV